MRHTVELEEMGFVMAARARRIQVGRQAVYPLQAPLT